ncbi:MAG: ThiF family adenylyltransferase [archaeon]|nr:ThiF family adenylyltransferase [archaeon]
MERKRILVVGAGGLGCEVIKGLAGVGFRDVEVVDMDRVERSNLNRQFLFREEDVGRPKAEVAAEAVAARVGPEMRCVGHFCPLESLPTGFFARFSLVLSCLDSVVARRWLGGTLIRISRTNEEETEAEREEERNGKDDAIGEENRRGGAVRECRVIPCVEGGVEGWKGHARVLVPGETPCVECLLELFPPQMSFAICTVAERPRSAEHCVEWARRVRWPEEFPGRPPPDGGNVEEVQWVAQEAGRRAGALGIDGVTEQLAGRVLRGTIGAVGATHAIVAGMMVTEAYKLATGIGQRLDNFCMYNGGAGQYAHAFRALARADCAVCGGSSAEVEASLEMTLAQLLELLRDHPSLQLHRPSLRTLSSEGRWRSIHFPSPPHLAAATLPNLSKTLRQLFFPHLSSSSSSSSSPPPPPSHADLFYSDPSRPFPRNLLTLRF